MRVALRKLRKATQEAIPAPICEVHGRSVSLMDVKNHFRKKLPSGQTLDDIPTPSQSRAPTPDDFLLKSNSNPVNLSLSNHSLTRSPIQLSDAKKEEACHGLKGTYKAGHPVSPLTLPVMSTHQDSYSYRCPVDIFAYSIRCPITSADNETALARTLAEIQYIAKIIPSLYQQSQDTFIYSRPAYEAQLVNHVWHLDRLAKSQLGNQQHSYLETIFQMACQALCLPKIIRDVFEDLHQFDHSPICRIECPLFIANTTETVVTHVQRSADPVARVTGWLFNYGYVGCWQYTFKKNYSRIDKHVIGFDMLRIVALGNLLLSKRQM